MIQVFQRGGPAEQLATEQVVAHLRRLIERGELRPGQRLPAERGLAKQIGVSRSSVRAGLRSLTAMRVLETRHGAGTFVTAGPPTLGSEPLRFMAALHGLGPDAMFEARRTLEVAIVGLAAERARPEDLAAIADEVSEGFAALDDPQVFLVHDIRFHRAVAAACGNPILASVVEMISALFYEQRRQTAGQARDLRAPAHLHRRIYQAIRARDRERAQAAMNEHLLRAEQAQASEAAGAAAPASAGGGHRKTGRSRPH
jgi:GntR family transcriptional regulator, transcriptional repressor for pyruvate dehydrogenase complex